MSLPSINSITLAPLLLNIELYLSPSICIWCKVYNYLHDLITLIIIGRYGVTTFYGGSEMALKVWNWHFLTRVRYFVFTKVAPRVIYSKLYCLVIISHLWLLGADGLTSLIFHSGFILSGWVPCIIIFWVNSRMLDLARYCWCPCSGTRGLFDK